MGDTYLLKQKFIPRSNEIKINRLRLNQTYLNAHQFKLNLTNNPLCNTCLVPETIEHILTNCVRLQEMHEKLNTLYGKKGKKVTIPEILVDKDIVEIIIHFLNKAHINI